jgi:RNA polymerase primary sigma factor
MTYEINPFYESDLKIEIDTLLSKLTKRESKILELYFGLNDNYSHTYEEIGDVFDLTRERVRLIKIKAISKLNGYINVLDLI